MGRTARTRRRDGLRQGLAVGRVRRVRSRRRRRRSVRRRGAASTTPSVKNRRASFGSNAISVTVSPPPRAAPPPPPPPPPPHPAPPALPLGLGGREIPVTEMALEPNDALLFFTDGVVEAGSPGGERFGADRLLDLTRRTLADRQTLSETVRRLVRAVRAHLYGPLADDATILGADWRPKR